MLSTVFKNPSVKETLKLTITDKDSSDPVVASVTIGEETKDSGIDGVVEFSLEYGDYEATIECEGYTTATEELAFRSNHKNFTVELEAAAETGTVTVTCQDSSENKVEGAIVVMGTQALDDPANFETWAATYGVGLGTTDNDGECTLAHFDPQTLEPTSDTSFEYGTYYLVSLGSDISSLNDELTVDGDEEVTITLTSGGGSTGTVTITTQDSNNDPIEGATVMLAIDLQDPTKWLGMGITDNNGECTLMELNPETYQPTQTVADVPFGTYTLFGLDSTKTLDYTDDSFVVDGDETATITLTSE